MYSNALESNSNFIQFINHNIFIYVEKYQFHVLHFETQA
jgi:hypothetical protein